MTVNKVPKISWLRKILQFLHFARAHANHENHAVFLSTQTHASVTTLQYRIYPLKKSVIFTLN